MDKNEVKRALKMSKLILADTEFATVSKEEALQDIEDSGVKSITPIANTEDLKIKARSYIDIVEDMFEGKVEKKSNMKLKPLMVESEDHNGLDVRIGRIEESLSEIKLALIEIKKNLI